MLAAYATSLIRFPFDYDQGEGFELYDAIRFARGENIYLDNGVWPFYSSNYPPVYRALLVPLIWLFGPRLYVGRIVALASVLLTVWLIWRAARDQRVAGPGQWLVPGIAALSFIAANYVYWIAPLARAHMPMVMFAFAGVYLIERGLRAGAGRWTLGIGVALLMVAGFTKLQAVDAMAAGFLYFLLRDPKRCLVSLAICAAAAAAVVFAMDTASAGQFWLNVVAANVNEYDINQTWFFYEQWWQLQAVMIVLATVHVLWDVARAMRARSLRAITVWSWWALSGAAMGMLTGKWGAGPAYLIGGMAAQCVCAAGLFFRIMALPRVQALRLGIWHSTASTPFAAPRALSGGTIISALFAAAFLLQALLNLHLHTEGRVFGPLAQSLAALVGRSKFPSSYEPYGYYDSVGYTQLGHVLTERDADDAFALSQDLAKLPGPILSEEAMFSIWAGKPVVGNPTQLYNLAKADMLDTRDIIARIRAKEFSAVLFRAQFYPKDVLAVIGQNYTWPKSPVKINGFDYWVLLANK